MQNQVLSVVIRISKPEGESDYREVYAQGKERCVLLSLNTCADSEREIGGRGASPP